MSMNRDGRFKKKEVEVDSHVDGGSKNLVLFLNCQSFGKIWHLKETRQ